MVSHPVPLWRSNRQLWLVLQLHNFVLHFYFSVLTLLEQPISLLRWRLTTDYILASGTTKPEDEIGFSSGHRLKKTSLLYQMMKDFFFLFFVSYLRSINLMIFSIPFMTGCWRSPTTWNQLMGSCWGTCIVKQWKPTKGRSRIRHTARLSCAYLTGYPNFGTISTLSWRNIALLTFS